MQPVDGEGVQDGAEVDRDDEVRGGHGDQQGEVEAGEPPRCLPCPGNPTSAERLLHEITHWPYRPWCESCVRGRAVGPNSKKVPEKFREAVVPKAHLDYAFLQDEVIENDDEFDETGVARISMTFLVMVETLCESVWAYATNAKGFASDPWLPKKIHNDLVTVGLGVTRIVMKTDNEPAIVDLRREVSRVREDAPTGFEDSRVGDSNSNGKIERMIREVKGLIRTFRASLQEKIGSVVALDAPVVPWIIRHAAYVITRCKVHDCGRTSLTRMKGQKSFRPLLPFGETVMFKVPKTRRRIGDFEDRFEKGVWLGMTVQSGENIVATTDGVYRVGGVMRRAPDQRWSAEMIQGIKGTPAEPKPGSGSDIMPTYAKHREDMKAVNYEKAPELEKAVRPAYIYKNDVMEHGATAGCKACSIAMNRGNTTGYTHSPACRMRFEEIFKNLGSEKLKRADARIDRAVYEASVGAEAPAAAPEEEKMDEDESGTAADPPAPEPIPPVPPPKF